MAISTDFSALTPLWTPDKNTLLSSNIARSMAELHFDNLRDFHTWSVNQYEDFWQYISKKLPIIFRKLSLQICDLTQGIESPRWFSGAKMNIVESCFQADREKIAIVYRSESHNTLQTLSFDQLDRLSNRVANSLVTFGFKPKDAIAIDMPMTPFAVAIYLGIIKMGGVVVSIADSFSKDEIITRLTIADTKAIFTQDIILRGGKKIPLYQKISDANAPRAIVLAREDTLHQSLRANDMAWHDFLVEQDIFETVLCDPMTHCNLLFSSGTTGTPKAIPWNHTTPIKSASDGYFHHNIQSEDIIAWPTNLGWMMGPWLIFSAFINRATIAIYDGAPHTREFGQFIQDANVTILGVIPSLVASWQQSHCMENLNWQNIKIFTSTAECSNPTNMHYLSSLAGGKPIIEYCGGTEIGGAYISSTVIEPNYASLFTTPTIGSDFVLIDENGNPTDNGEVALVPPTIGLSTELINADQHAVYYADMPTTRDGKILRRHGDQIQRLSNGYYTVLGRTDDTMNLGGIKISSAEIERALAGIEGITETAAIAIAPPDNGPSRLVIYAAASKTFDSNVIKKIMQEKINKQLNPLFKIFDVVFIKELPKTASNKIMRRILRKEYC